MSETHVLEPSLEQISRLKPLNLLKIISQAIILIILITPFWGEKTKFETNFVNRGLARYDLKFVS